MWIMKSLRNQRGERKVRLAGASLSQSCSEVSVQFLHKYSCFLWHVCSLIAVEVKKSGKAKKKDKHASRKDNNNLERHVEVSTANSDEIPSVDEDCSRGMKSNVLLLSSDI